MSDLSKVIKEDVVNASVFRKKDYILTFRVEGVSVFVTDIHLEAYKDLEVLYVIDQGVFKQYFKKSAYELALDRGLAFYSDPNLFNQYKKDLIDHCNRFKVFFESEISDKDILAKDIVQKFFEYTKKLCEDYSKMNFECTDKAFQSQENNPIIKKNLEGVAIFKDQVRVIMNTVLFEPDGYTSTLFNILGKQFKIDSSILNDLMQEEILALYHFKKLGEASSLRQQAFVEHNDECRFYEGDKALRIVEEFRDEIRTENIFTGQVASKGYAKGKVKIIPVDYSNLERVNLEIEKMVKGDILVAETTAPELIVACQKAGAIVTDMGGLMSHAAIVSREFKIPCIVGTINASKTLKDGDMVEVDAGNGVVRLLK